MGIDKPEMFYDYEEGRNTVPDRLPFDVNKLVNAGVVFVTPAIDGDRESKTYKKWLDEPYSHLITLRNIDHSNKDSWIHKAITKKAPTNVWSINSVHLSSFAFLRSSFDFSVSVDGINKNMLG